MDWTHNDIPLNGYSVVTEPNLATGEIRQITEICGQIEEEFFQAKSDGVRNALIDIGWTPPDSDQIPQPQLVDLVDQYRPFFGNLMCRGLRVIDLTREDLYAIICALSQGSGD